MSEDIGLDKFGKGHGRFMTWGYLPHEDKYQKPTIDGRNAAVIMKSGVYDGATDTHQADGSGVHPRGHLHAWYDEPGGCIPFDRTTTPMQKNTVDIAGKYSWSTAVRTTRMAGSRPGPLARQLVAGGKHGESLAALRSAGARHVQEAGRRQRDAAPLRAHA